MTGVAAGTLYGVGMGPGDPDLVTVRAARVIGAVDVVAYHCAGHGRSRALAAAAPHMRPGQLQERLMYPVTTGTTDHPGGYDGAMADFYDEATRRLTAHLEAGRSVALLAMGDPFLYSSHQHLHARLAGRFPAEVIPGISSPSAAASAMGTALVEGDEVLTILPGTLPRDELARRLRATDAAVVLKLGRNLDTVRSALADSGRLAEATIVVEAGTDAERVEPLASAGSVPYFSVAVVPSPSRSGARERALPGPGSLGEVVVVGLGPGGEEWRTPEASRELAAATDIVGYTTYVARVPVLPGQRRHASDNRVEAERAAMALDMALGGARVAVVSSGDPGVFAMAAAVLETADDDRWRDVPVRIVPGVTAASAVAARVGAPLGHDFALLSLSDRLKPWDIVERRLDAVAAADMAFAVYNPASMSRRWQVGAMRDVVLRHRSPETPVIVARAVGSADESVAVTTLAELDPETVDMRTMVVVGASTTRVYPGPEGPRVYTSRRYGD